MLDDLETWVINQIKSIGAQVQKLNRMEINQNVSGLCWIGDFEDLDANFIPVSGDFCYWRTTDKFCIFLDGNWREL